MTASDPIIVMTPFGHSIIEGPFAEDFTTLKWQYREYRDGETARYRVAGLEAYVCDCDGDSSWWHVKDIRTKTVIAEGEDWGWDPPHFFKCLSDAEAALRSEVSRRAQALRGKAASHG